MTNDLTKSDKALYKLLCDWKFKSGEVIKLGSIIHLLDGLDVEYDSKDVSRSLARMLEDNLLEIVGESNVKLTDYGYEFIHNYGCS
jgi:hypothetical protein